MQLLFEIILYTCIVFPPNVMFDFWCVVKQLFCAVCIGFYDLVLPFIGCSCSVNVVVQDFDGNMLASIYRNAFFDKCI
jgi:hypothetical protein